jgi:hypothetical protein
MGTVSLYRGVKRQEQETYHSNPSKAEVQNEWSYVSHSTIYRNNVPRYNVTITFTEALLCTEIIE